MEVTPLIMHTFCCSKVHFSTKDEVGKLIQICPYGKHPTFGDSTHEVWVPPLTARPNLNKLHNIYS